MPDFSFTRLQAKFVNYYNTGMPFLPRCRIPRIIERNIEALCVDVIEYIQDNATKAVGIYSFNRLSMGNPPFDNPDFDELIKILCEYIADIYDNSGGSLNNIIPQAISDVTMLFSVIMIDRDNCYDQMRDAGVDVSRLRGFVDEAYRKLGRYGVRRPYDNYRDDAHRASRSSSHTNGYSRYDQVDNYPASNTQMNDSGFTGNMRTVSSHSARREYADTRRNDLADIAPTSRYSNNSSTRAAVPVSANTKVDPYAKQKDAIAKSLIEQNVRFNKIVRSDEPGVCFIPCNGYAFPPMYDESMATLYYAILSNGTTFPVLWPEEKEVEMDKNRHLGYSSNYVARTMQDPSSIEAEKARLQALAEAQDIEAAMQQEIIFDYANSHSEDVQNIEELKTKVYPISALEQGWVVTEFSQKVADLNEDKPGTCRVTTTFAAKTDVVFGGFDRTLLESMGKLKSFKDVRHILNAEIKSASARLSPVLIAAIDKRLTEVVKHFLKTATVIDIDFDSFLESNGQGELEDYIATTYPTINRSFVAAQGDMIQSALSVMTPETVAACLQNYYCDSISPNKAFPSVVVFATMYKLVMINCSTAALFGTNTGQATRAQVSPNRQPLLQRICNNIIPENCKERVLLRTRDADTFCITREPFDKTVFNISKFTE